MAKISKNAKNGVTAFTLGQPVLPGRLPFSLPQGHDYFEAKSQLASPGKNSQIH